MRSRTLWETITQHRGLVIYMVVLMMCFNLFSHGTQDLYPTFLQKQHNFDPGTVSWIVIVANLGAIAGGLTFGHLSEKIGRINAITVAALIALPALPLWAFASTPILLAIGAFIMQVAVQGAWGVIPAHLNELSPGAARATIPAFVYQAGNFLASYNGPFQAQIAQANGGNYGFALALVAGVVAIAIVIVDPFQSGAAGRTLDGALSVPAFFEGTCGSGRGSTLQSVRRLFLSLRRSQLPRPEERRRCVSKDAPMRTDIAESWKYASRRSAPHAAP